MRWCRSCVSSYGFYPLNRAIPFIKGSRRTSLQIRRANSSVWKKGFDRRIISDIVDCSRLRAQPTRLALGWVAGSKVVAVPHLNKSGVAGMVLSGKSVKSEPARVCAC